MSTVGVGDGGGQIKAGGFVSWEALCKRPLLLFALRLIWLFTPSFNKQLRSTIYLPGTILNVWTGKQAEEQEPCLQQSINPSHHHKLPSGGDRKKGSGSLGKEAQRSQVG